MGVRYENVDKEGDFSNVHFVDAENLSRKIGSSKLNFRQKSAKLFYKRRRSRQVQGRECDVR